MYMAGEQQNNSALTRCTSRSIRWHHVYGCIWQRGCVLLPLLPPATQRPVLHSTRRCTARSIKQCPALHCIANIAQRSVLAAVSPSAPLGARGSKRSAGEGRAQREAQRYTARSATQRAALHSAQRYTAPSASLRPALHCAQRYAARSAAQCAALYSPPFSSAAQRAALHIAQRYTAPSAT